MIKVMKLVEKAKKAIIDRDNEIVKLYEEGMNASKIASVSGMSRTAVVHIINRSRKSIEEGREGRER